MDISVDNVAAGIVVGSSDGITCTIRYMYPGFGAL